MSESVGDTTAPQDYSTRFNILAIVSFGLTLTLACPPLSLILGHIARRQIRRTGERGGALASISVFYGSFITSLVMVWFLVFVVGSWLPR